MTPDYGVKIPGRLPLLLSREGVLLPGSTTRFSVDSPRNMKLVRERLLRGASLKSTIIGVIPNSRDPQRNADELPPLHKWVKFTAASDSSAHLCRVCVTATAS